MPSHLCLVLGALIVSLVHGNIAERDLPSLLHDTEVNDGAPTVGISDDDEDFEVEFVYTKDGSDTQHLSGLSAAGGVKRMWGIPDTEALAGRLFSYPIPSDAFDGDVTSYEFQSLPPWLSFSSRRGVLEGVPGVADIGSHYITIRAEGTDGSAAKDAFAVEVLPVTTSQILQENKCLPKEELTVVSIVIDSPVSAQQSKQRVKLIQRISTLFMVKMNRVSLTAAPADFDPLSDESAIMAGPGSSDVQNLLRPSREGPQGYSQLQWSVGCGGEISKEMQQQIDNVELACKNGKLEKLIGVPVVGWHVTVVNPITKRRKREAAEHESSGDYTDYEYDYEDYFGVLDRPVPSLATPVFPESPVSIYHDKSSPPEGGRYVSPVFKPLPLSTPVYVPVKPTRVVVDASPTIIFRTEYPFAHIESELESSLLTHPTTSADYTTPLTGTSTVSSEPTRPVMPIEATSVPDKSETTEYDVKNFAPRINNRIQKLAWIAGNVYRMQIPNDAFYDIEDGDTRNLTLILKDERGLIFPRDYWIQFDPAKQEVYGLPLEKDIGNYNFYLEAMDRDRKSVKDFFPVSVRQHSQARNFHHQFTAVLKLEKKYEYDFAYSLDWQVKAVEKIAALFRDSVSSINVRNITVEPVQITWTNVSLIDSSSTVCPTEELEAVAEVMLEGHSSEPSRTAEKVFRPEFQLKKIKTQFFDPCEPHFHHGHHHHGHAEPHPFSPIEETSHSGLAAENSGPIVRNQIDQLTAFAGQLYRFQVPMETCYDLEDGNSRNLKMQLLTTDFIVPPEDSWLQFDSANQEFFGLPLTDDLGRKEYLLECMDKGGKTVTDALIVEVIRNSSSSSAHTPVHFGLTVNADYDALMSNAYQKAKLIDKIGRAFGDMNASNVVVDFLRRGSVVVEWHNGSLPTDPCPEEEVQRLRDIMTDDNGQLRKKFKKAFLPDFQVVDGEIIPSGSCLAGDTPTHFEEPDIGTPEEEEISSSDEDYLLTFIVPAVIIAVMLLLAAVIACCVYRRRRYGKMSMTDERTFVSKGIPIIFAEELDDHRPESAKSPIIMKEEKPPLPPPEYQRNSPPRSDRQRPHSGDGNLSDDAPYHPPPPFTSSNGASRNQRPNLPPAYRKPPTYVPP